MAQQIIKQPNGLYAIWCTVYDMFIYTDITAKEYIKIRIKKEALNIKREVTKQVKQLDVGKKPYYQFTMTYKEALKLQKETYNK